MLIDLPMSPAMRRLPLLIVAAATLLILFTPVDVPYRILASAVCLLVGVLLWRRYLRRRPAGLIGQDGGRLVCLARNGRRWPVTDVHTGIARPWLLSARITDASGPRDLFVPGWALDRHDHWRLRRAIKGFRGPGDTAGNDNGRPT